ncbi:hypothetical protein BKA69DRAFT_131615 [Paraphysoderma sedebokerense]|nr:hypothetical protein BKA69DRAFT_131615 [Paraphysoderma sedebokerense]
MLPENAFFPVTLYSGRTISAVRLDNKLLRTAMLSATIEERHNLGNFLHQALRLVNRRFADADLEIVDEMTLTSNQVLIVAFNCDYGNLRFMDPACEPDVVGCIYYYPATRRDLHINYLAVNAQWGGNGIGQTLIEKVIEEAVESQYRHVSLECLETMIGFYEGKFGFRKVRPTKHDEALWRMVLRF